MSTQSRLPGPLPGGPVASSASFPDAQFYMGHDVAPPVQESLSNLGPTNRPVNGDPPMPRTCRFAPFDEHLNELVRTPRWQKDLDDHFTNIFKRSVLSGCPIDDVVERALWIIGRPTQVKIRGLALVIYMHWMRMQFRCKDTNVSAPEIVALISRITDHLGWRSVHAQKDFVDELSYLCIEKLKLTWRWYVAVVTRGALPIPRENLFMRVMAVVAMISHLFRSGQLQFGTALNGLGYIAMMSPWPDAVAIIYALLHELGPRFALEQPGWHFIQRLLADLFPLTMGRVRVHPLCQLVTAINTLVAEWHNRTRVTLYHTFPKGNNQFHAHHS
ncbi:hypothetical protein J3R82DRAFT_6025 [Butyriboletus roseoflavus]|nr:hypothetical protein J3R82DRAFT_6025 [Butyriboletus roseoflavus]